MSIEKNIASGLCAGGRISGSVKNTPAQYKSREKQYLSNPSARFTEKISKYASNFVKARVQGLDPNDRERWTETRIRMADIAPDSASTLRKQDDYKIVLFADRRIEYVPEGSKIETMGSTWLVVNPTNISNEIGGGIIQRCRTVWNHLDWYGNLLSEPICAEKAILTANESDMQEYALITKGYVNIVCQCNAETRQLNTNSRIILGSGAYRITGFGDWSQEFTGDYDSVRLMEFTARYEPVNPEIDDMKRHVAGGKTFSWEIRIKGNPVIKTGRTQRFAAESLRMGETVENSMEHPIFYEWESSDESVAEVSPDGLVSAVKEGSCMLRCRLVQNREVFQTMEITVVPADGEKEIAFLGNVPDSLRAYETLTLEAAVFENGTETDEAITFTCSGAEESAYTAKIDGNTISVTCWHASAQAIKITAANGEIFAEARIRLEGI